MGFNMVWIEYEFIPNGYSNYFAGILCDDCLSDKLNHTEIVSIVTNKVIEPTLYKELICEFCSKREKVTIYEKRK